MTQIQTHIQMVEGALVLTRGAWLATVPRGPHGLQPLTLVLSPDPETPNHPSFLQAPLSFLKKTCGLTGW